MTRRSDRDRPLLAGRIKPTRKPPVKVAGPILRLTHDGDSEPVFNQKHDSVSDKLHAAIHAGHALHRALRHYSSMVTCLESAEIEVSRSHDGDVGNTVQRQLDTQLASLSALCESKARDGRALFDGDWSLELYDVAGAPVGAVNLPTVSLATLGSDGIGGRLVSLVAQRENCLNHVGPATVLAILRSAILWIASERERVFRTLADLIEPLVAELEIAEANLAAVNDATDSGFCASVAEISKLTVMSQTPLSDSSSTQPQSHQGWRLSHSDDE